MSSLEYIKLIKESKTRQEVDSYLDKAAEDDNINIEGFGILCSYALSLRF